MKLMVHKLPYKKRGQQRANKQAPCRNLSRKVTRAEIFKSRSVSYLKHGKAYFKIGAKRKAVSWCSCSSITAEMRHHSVALKSPTPACGSLCEESLTQPMLALRAPLGQIGHPRKATVAGVLRDSVKRCSAKY